MEFYHPEVEVMWKKDRNTYLSNGLPLDGFILEFNARLVYDGSISLDEKIVDAQGTYQCIVRGMRPFQTVKSDIVTFSFSGKITYFFSITGAMLLSGLR